MGYWAELNRRNVVRAVGAFLVGGWLLLQIATALEEAMDLPAWFDTFVAALLLIGLPVVAVFSWAYEITPEGLRKTSEIDDDASITGETGKRLDKITLAGVVLIIGLFAYQQFAPPRISPAAPGPGASTELAVAEAPAADSAAAGSAEGATDQSIAVLPFVAMSQSKDDEFFADGLSEELLNVLANISGLKVAGRTSSFYYKGKNEDLREIASALGVANILEGSVRRSGDTLRVTAQLIQAKDGFHLWSETFDRDDGDTFAIQDEIASSVARALQSELIGTTEAKPTTPRNVEAQNLYLVAQAALAERNLTDVKRARDLFAQARELSPETPRYASGYAHAVSLMYWNFRALGPDEAISEASKAIEQALASGPPSADTLAIAGLVEELRAITVSDPDAKRKALEFYQQALDQDLGNILALQWLASIYVDTYDYEQASLYFERVLELDPLNILALTGLAGAQARLGQTAEAREGLYKVFVLFPESGQSARYLATLEFDLGRIDRSLYWGQQAIRIDPNPLDLFAQSMVWVLAGREDNALATAEKFQEINSDVDIRNLIQARIAEDYERLAIEADRLFLRTGSDDFAVASAFANAMNNEFSAVIRILERQFPSLKGEEAEYLDGTDFIPIVLLVRSYQQQGNTQAAERLANLLLESNQLSERYLDPNPQLRLTRAQLRAALGQSSDALNDLKRLRELGVAVGFNTLAIPVEQDPSFESLRDQPEFAEFVEFARRVTVDQSRAFVEGETEQEVVAEMREAGLAVTSAEFPGGRP